MAELYPFQRDGVEFLLGRRRGYLAFGCGLGKTPTTCVAAKLLHPKHVVVIAPASALPGWVREWNAWGGYDPDIRFTVVSYEHVVKHPHQFDKGVDLCVLDEAHYVKSRTAQRTLAALNVARNAGTCWLLSATPMPNHPAELWTVMRALWPQLVREFGISNYREWLDTFCRWTPSPYGPKVWGAKNPHLLRPALNRIMLRKQLRDVALELPPLRIDTQLMPMKGLDKAVAAAGIDAKALLKQMEAEEQSEFGSLSRLRRLLGTLKAPGIAAIIADELYTQQYDRIVILAQHHDTINVMGDLLAQYGVTGFTGEDSSKERERAITEFTRGKARVFVAQQQAAGIAINLQVASELVLVEPSWSPGDNAQAIQRIHRIGSEQPCRARIFAVAQSLDESIMDTIARKTRMAVELGL